VSIVRAPCRGLVLSVSVLALAWSMGCGRSSSSRDPFDGVTGDGRGVIGPDGGTVEVKDPSSPIAGVKVTVPAGALTDRWIVDLYYRTVFETPDYPTGYLPFERPQATGSLEVGLSGHNAAPPASIPMELSFPLAKILEGPGEIVAAFYYDADGRWRVKLPVSVGDTALVVASDRRHVRWSWGRIDLSTVDFQGEVEPALAERHGADTMAAIQQAMAEVQAKLAAQKLAETCEGLALARAFLVGFQDAAQTAIDEYQVGAEECGVCDVKSPSFYGDMGTYFEELIEKEYVAYMVGKLVADATDSIILGALAEMSMAGACEAAMRSLSCDYACFFGDANAAELIVYLAEYWGFEMATEVLDAYRDSIGCST
jgi:hypothetical protein